MVIRFPFCARPAKDDRHRVPYPIQKGSQPLAGGYAKRYHRMTGEIKATRSRRDRSTFALASLRDATGGVGLVSGGGAALTTG
ncbi:MAG: hypothetical protein EA424_28405 [Planctomycetaceae bacterium]|nr:MAG: hypothetical protein EA424_28405 [Planctomycetaceae bacterium]